MKKLLLAGLLCLTASAPSYANESYYHYLHGRLAEQKGDLETARKDYEKALEFDPHAIEVLRDLSQLDLRQGRLDAALRNAQTMTQLTPKSSPALLFLGNIYALRGDVESALNQYKAALSVDPENEEALIGLASFYGEQGDAQAEKYFKNYFSLYDDADMTYRYGLWLDKRKRTDEAIRELKKASAQAPRFLSPRVALAEIYETRKSSESIHQYERCLDIEPNSPGITVRLANLYYENRQYDKATRLFQKALDFFPSEPSIYYWLARCYEAQRSWKEADTYLRKAYRLNFDPQVLPVLAYYATMRGDSKQAIRWLRKAQKAEPDNPVPLLYLGFGEYDLGNMSQARAVFVKYLALKPNDTQALFHLAVIEDQKGDFSRAEALLQKIIQIDPRHSSALNYLGYSYVDRNRNLEEAEQLIRRAVAEESSNGAYLDSLGWVLYKRGRIQKAREPLETAVKYTSDPVLYEHLATVYDALGSTVSAVATWQKAIHLGSKAKAAKETLARWEKIQDYSAYAPAIVGLVALNEDHIVKWSRDATLEISSGAVTQQWLAEIVFKKPQDFTLRLSSSITAAPFEIRVTSGTLGQTAPLTQMDPVLLASLVEMLNVAFNPPWRSLTVPLGEVTPGKADLMIRKGLNAAGFDPRMIRPARWERHASDSTLEWAVEWKRYELGGDLWLPGVLELQRPGQKLKIKLTYRRP